MIVTWRKREAAAPAWEPPPFYRRAGRLQRTVAVDRAVQVALHLADGVLHLALELVDLALGLQALVARQAAQGVLHVTRGVRDLALQRVLGPALGQALVVHCAPPVQVSHPLPR